MEATFVKAGNTARERILKAKFDHPAKKMALIISHEKIGEVIDNIAGKKAGIKVEMKIRNINGQRNVEKFIEREGKEWQKEEVGRAEWMGGKYQKLCEEIQNSVKYEKEEGDEPIPGFAMPLELVIPTVKDFKKQKRAEIKSKCKQLKIENITKAWERNNQLFHRAPGKL
eukprot:Phypoly_transcript_07244.p1 GENE.Phypoly_transcript_07244~~Phypoly_transcript_07244.p1  ORF type:complete len:170 (-),score=28.63 Phypoly_transcript_07244:849-1358(-)